MALLLDYLPLFGEAEYDSGSITIRGIASVIAIGEVLSPTSVSVSIVGRAYLTLDLRQIYPVVTVLVPKQATINSYILRRDSEVQVSNRTAHIEMEQRHPEIKVIDID